MATINQLREQLGGNALNYCCLDTSEMSEPIALGVPPLELSANSELIPFEKYCFACHRGNPAARLNFMGGETEQEVIARVKDTDKIRDALDWKRYTGTDKESTLMPPSDSHQRAELDAAISAGDPALEQMRDSVPSMFDF